jgi:hypothetical protein
VRSRHLLASLAALLLVGAAAPASAGAWTAPVNLSAAGQSAFSPQVAVDTDGDAVFTWARSDGSKYRVQALARSAAGVLSGVDDLSASGQSAYSPQVAVDTAGDAVFTWERSDGSGAFCCLRIEALARSAAGVLGPVQTLSAAGQDGFGAEVAVDTDGDAVFTWSRFDGTYYRVQARARSAGGVLGPVQNLSAAGQNAFDPQVAIDSAGDAVCTWQRFDGTNYRVQARARSAAGVLSAVQTLSVAGQDATLPQVAVDTNGDAVLTWQRSDGTNSRIQARGRSAAGALGPLQTLSPAGQDAFDPQVAIDSDGDAVLTWRRSDGTNSRVQARGRSAAAVLSAVQTLSPAGQDAFSPQVAVDPDGDAVVTWYRLAGTNPRILVRARSAAGALGPVQTLSDTGQGAGFPQVAVDAAGAAVVTWQNVTTGAIQAAFGP